MPEERAVRERDRHADALLALSRRIEGAQTEREVFDAAFDALKTCTRYRHSWVFVFDQEGQFAHFYLGNEGPAQDPTVQTLTIKGDAMMEEILRTRDIVVVEDARTDPRTNKEIVGRLDNRTIINVPILLNDQSLGSVGTGTFGDEGVVPPSIAEKDFLKAVASQLAISLDRLHNRSEWQRARIALQAGEARYESLVRAMAEGVVFHAQSGLVTSVNPAAERLLGASAEQLIGTQLFCASPPLGAGREIVSEDALPWHRTRTIGLAQSNVTLGAQRADGETVWLSVNTVPLNIEEEPPYEVVTTFRDITEQLGLRQQLEMFQAALDGVIDSAFLMDQECFVQVNEGACRGLGYSRRELIGKTIFDIDPDITRERLASLIASAEDKDRVGFESHHRRKDGSVFPVEVEISPFAFDGRMMTIALARDITERKKGEEALRRLNRTLLTLSSGNEALVRAGSERELLDRMCRILVEVGGHRVVWIDLTDKPNGSEMIPSASASATPAGDFVEGRLPCTHILAKTLSSGEARLILDIATEPACDSHRQHLMAAGCRCGLVLPLIASRGLIGTLSIFAETLDAFDKAEFDLLRELADDLAFGIQAQRIHSEQVQAVARLQKTMESTILALANTLELRDPYTAGHQRRVAKLGKAIALRLGIDHERAESIYLAGMIHDIGKIYVPSEVLSRPGRLTPLEYSLTQTHVEAAYGILHPIDFSWPLADVVYQHHERLDGSGYPRGIRGDEIMLDARILAVADVVEAMSAHRPYRPGLGIDAALAEIESGKKTLYDPDVVDQCIALFREDHFQFD